MLVQREAFLTIKKKLSTATCVSTARYQVSVQLQRLQPFSNFVYKLNKTKTMTLPLTKSKDVFWVENQMPVPHL